MNGPEIEKHIARLEQPQLSAGLASASQEQKEAFLGQLEKYDPRLLARQREELFSKRPSGQKSEPYRNYDRAGSGKDQLLGERLVGEGKVGCLILAGGQGTRLQTKGPKGTFPITLIKQKSLFQLQIEKALAASKRAGRFLPLAIMTSPANHKETKSYLEQNSWFGMPSSHVALFVQEMLPFLDDQGNWLLEAPAKIAAGPDGNGGALHAFFQSGIWKQWSEMGIEILNIIPIDNPLADPFDAELCGYFERTKKECVLKCVQKCRPDEKVGLLVKENEKIKVIEYSELSPEENWDDAIAYTGLLCLSMNFIRKVVEDPSGALPWHFARKEADVLLGTSKGSFVERVKVWKCESFLFDLLAFADRVGVLLFPRELCFAPLKNSSGEASIETVRAALLAYDRHIYSALANLSHANRIFELDPAFYYPTPRLSEKWKGRALPDVDYVEAD